MYAPSAGNERPWHFVVIKDREKLDKIPTFHPHTLMLKEAPMAIVVCADTRAVKYDGAYWIQDIAASIQNMLLEAEHLGLGTCWCGLYPRMELADGVSDLIKLPDQVEAVALIALGYPGETRQVRERFDEDRVHYEEW